MSRMDPQEARQGRKGTPVLRILVVALVLMVIAGIGMAIYGRSMPDQTLPKGDVGGGVNAPAPTTPTAGQGSTVTPQSSGTAPGGNTAN